MYLALGRMNKSREKYMKGRYDAALFGSTIQNRESSSFDASADPSNPRYAASTRVPMSVATKNKRNQVGSHILIAFAELLFINPGYTERLSLLFLVNTK